MLNSTAKVSHDLPPGAPQGIRKPRRRGLHDAVRHRAHHAAHSPARTGRGRPDSHRRGDRVPRLLRPRHAAGAASLTMFISVLLTLTRSWRDSEMVIWFGSGAVAYGVAQAGDAVRAAADRGDRRAVAHHLAVGRADGRAVRDAAGGARRRFARQPRRVRRDREQGARVFRRIDVGRRHHGAERVRELGAAAEKRRQHEPGGPHRDGAERRPLHRAGKRSALRRRPRRRAVPRHGVPALCRAH